MAGELAENAVGFADFLLCFLRVDPAPVTVGPSVRTDGHAGAHEFAHLVGVQPPGLAEAAGQHEEVGFETTLE